MTARPMRLAVFLLAVWASTAAAVEQYEVQVLERKAQSRELFVQGLEIVDGQLYVSTGTYGGSALYRYDFDSGELLHKHRLDRRIFAEGLTVLGEHVYQLTWRNRAMLVYERKSLRPQRSVKLPGEAWGLTNDGQRLIYSDGSEHLHFLSPQDGTRLHSITVTEHGRPLRALNELEWIDGEVWANVWRSERIVIIDPTSGEVTGSVNLRNLLPAPERQRDTDVLNGIARNPADGAIWVTGKRWPWMYRVELLTPAQSAPLD